jgi:hypothetical protein
MATTIMQRIRRARLRLTLAGALALLGGAPAIAAAQASDPARCEALQLKKESAYYECLSRCERRAARGRIDLATCDGRCEAAFEGALFRVEQSPPCQPEPSETPEPEPGGEDETPRPARTPAPDPEQCEAQLLKVEARLMLCHGRCTARAARNADVDKPACDAVCDQHAQAAFERRLAKPICASGRVPSGEMRSEADH